MLGRIVAASHNSSTSKEGLNSRVECATLLVFLGRVLQCQSYADFSASIGKMLDIFRLIEDENSFGGSNL